MRLMLALLVLMAVVGCEKTIHEAGTNQRPVGPTSPIAPPPDVVADH